MEKVSLLPQRQGLYDPFFEHDGCGIGFVAHIKGERSHEIVRAALRILVNLDHRGGVGSDPQAGDGAGILTQIPDGFFRRACHGIDLPAPGEYAVGMLFLPPDPKARAACEEAFAAIVRAEGGVVLGWRTVPVEEGCLGSAAREGMPAIRQVFIGRGAKTDAASFLRMLYVIRKEAEKTIRYGGRVPGGERFYVASLSPRTIVYKGLLTAAQVPEFYRDLVDPSFTSAIALVHSRFSTNTFPSWERAHPYRYLVHNGEINTLRANINWMRARDSAFAAASFAGMEMKKILPVLAPDGSDSAMFDNCLEFLLMTGRSLPQAVMMMIPEPWEKAAGFMSEEKRAFYEYHSYLMEPWDGPAAMAFTDGVVVGAVLDRNGLRPARYWVTEDDLVILASEAGVIPLPPEKIREKGRLRPGRLLLVDTAAGRIVADEEIKESIARAHPYRTWLAEGRLYLSDLPPARPAALAPAEVRRYQKAFGYTHEDLRLILAPMAQDGVEPVGSMGYDAPLAVLSERPQLLYDYFKQLFAQVTNPAIDAIREEIVTSTEVALGPFGDLLAHGPEVCRQIRLSTPILTDEELARLKEAKTLGFAAEVLPILFPAKGEEERDLEEALADLFRRADEAIAAGARILILSDRAVDRDRAAIPALLAAAGLHHHLIRRGTRMRVGLVLESGEPREVHHFALLLGYGVAAINPYLAFATLAQMIRDGLLGDLSYEQAVANYVKAATKGVLKVASKMGISTLRGYQGAQVFEAVGIDPAVIECYFTGTPSRVGGIGLAEIAREARLRHAAAFSAGGEGPLPSGGHYQWRRDGEEHLFNPETVYKLQRACRTGDYGLYREYAAAVNERERPCTLRSLFAFCPVSPPVPLSEVEPVEAICRRFKTGAMSFGSISREVHEALAIAMNRLGGKSNTGEGGEDPARFVPLPNGDSLCSAIKQVASGRFGVTSEYLVHAEEIQIKIAQGAKPGEGGQLPGGKVYPWIARVRHSIPGVGLISPPPHHDIYSIEDLAELIYDLKNANPRARINVKLVSAAGVGTIAVGVAKAGADVILISGYDGGTGAAPRSSIRHAGLPWELGLAETHQTLILNGLRDRVVLEVDGKLMTGRDVIVAALLGAEEFGFATAPLVALGCDMMRHCNLDTCPVGIATQNPDLRRRFAGDPEHVVNLMRFIAREAREIMAGLGFRSLAEMVGRTEVLVQRPIDHWKARKLDLSALLYRPEGLRSAPSAAGEGRERRFVFFDREKLLSLCRPALEEGRPVRAILPVANTDRAVGTMLGSEVTRRCGAAGLPEDTIRLHLVGSAGQSFGAFLPPGITLILEGEANDYLGKGLSGGKIVVYPPATSRFAAEENVIIGNVALYGATGGEAYIRGLAGERFCVRNSGAKAVVEGVGDHGCEYMTGGRVVVLGPTGRNFAAGMSGGIAYVLDEKGDFPRRLNPELVELERLADPQEIEEVRAMIRRHLEYTGSEVARRVLADWERAVTRFVKVMPRDYKRALAVLAAAGGEEGLMAAFEVNKRDRLRVSGN